MISTYDPLTPERLDALVGKYVRVVAASAVILRGTVVRDEDFTPSFGIGGYGLRGQGMCLPFFPTDRVEVLSDAAPC